MVASLACSHAPDAAPGASGPLPVRNLVTLLGGIVAIVTALSAPIGYGIIGYLKEAQSLTYRAELTASRAAQYIYAPDAPWKYDTDQLAAISEIVTPTAVPIVQRLIDKQGAAMMQKGKALPWPTFARDAPIFASGAMVGTARGIRQPASAADGGRFRRAGRAGARHCRLLRLCHPAARRHRSNAGRARELPTTSWRNRTCFSTRRWRTWPRGWPCTTPRRASSSPTTATRELYGLDPEQTKPGTSLRKIVELRMASGLYAGQNVDDVYKTMRERAWHQRGEPCHQQAPRRARHRRDDPAEGRRRLGRDAPGHHRARDPQRAAGAPERAPEAARGRAEGAERALQCGHQQHVAGHEPVRCRAARGVRQSTLCRDLRPRTRRGKAGHDAAPDPGGARGARGVYNNIDAAKFVEEGVASFSQEMSQIVHLADGRFISVVRRPMADGGLVSTHEDVTEREKLNARLAAQNDLCAGRRRSSRRRTSASTRP